MSSKPTTGSVAPKETWRMGQLWGTEGGRFTGQCIEGKPDGVWRFNSWSSVGTLEVRYTKENPAGQTTYFCSKHDGTLRIEGPWVNTGDGALPHNATCSWTGEHQHFYGTVDPVVEQDFASRLCSAYAIGAHYGLRNAWGLDGACGVLSRMRGRVVQVDASGMRFEGGISIPHWFGEHPPVNATGKLTLPVSQNPHQGSPDVAQGYVDGVWEDSKLVQGEGTFTLKDGTRYEGGLGAGGMMHGRGMLCWSGGASYEGTFDNGCLQDHGTLTWADGEQLTGNFFRTPTWQTGSLRSICDISFGDKTSVRFSFDAQGQPDATTLIHLGAS